MSIELATTQPVRQHGTPPPPGMPRADELGLTLRERLWLTRAALGIIVLSFVASLGMLTMLPPEQAAPVGAMQTMLAERALEPMPVERIVPITEPLPVAEIHRPVGVAVASAVEPAPVASPAPLEEKPVLVSKPGRRVVISRGNVSPYSLPAERAVDLSRPQSLAPQKPAREPEPIERQSEAEQKPLAKPRAEPELKRPSFE